MMRNLKVATIQMKCTWDAAENIAKAEKLVREAAAQGAQIILLPEFFETPMFCQIEDPNYFMLAKEIENSAPVNHFKKIAQELQVVLPVSFFERKNNARYNSVAVIDADGAVLGVYRKSHIPDGPGYEEKFYLNPGNTGFKVWQTRYAKIGVGICWDQWFPEAARCLVIQGAEVLFYPSAIGSEPPDPEMDSKEIWQLCMRGHAVANIVPVVAANRVGLETMPGSEVNFYGSAFISNHRGELIAAGDRTSEAALVAEFDLDLIELHRADWGIFRDRRPDLYLPLLTFDGH
jgi:N-carbamoylputrescine amidase